MESKANSKLKCVFIWDRIRESVHMGNIWLSKWDKNLTIGEFS